MRSKIVYFLQAFILGAVPVFVSACTAGHANPITKPSVQFESVSPKGIVLENVRIYEDTDELVIRGDVERTFNNCCDAVRGHIDVAVVAPDESVLDIVSVRYTPREIPRVTGRTSRFTVRLPYTIPEDMSLQITYHGNLEVADSADDNNKFQCKRDNMIYTNEG